MQCRGDESGASDSIDDIPDRGTLRATSPDGSRQRPVGIRKLRKQNHEGYWWEQRGEQRSKSGANCGAPSLLRGELRARGGAMNRTLGDVIQEVARGAFTLPTLGTLGDSDAGKVEAALRELEQMAAAR